MNKDKLLEIIDDIEMSLDLDRIDDALENIIKISEIVKFKMSSEMLLKFNEQLKDFLYAYESKQNEMLVQIFNKNLSKILKNAICENNMEYTNYEYDVFGKDGYITLAEYHLKKKKQGKYVAFYMEVDELNFIDAKNIYLEYIKYFKLEDRTKLCIKCSKELKEEFNKLKDNAKNFYGNYPEVYFVNNTGDIDTTKIYNVIEYSEEDCIWGKLYSIYREFSQGDSIFETDRLKRIYDTTDNYEKNWLFIKHPYTLETIEYIKRFEKEKILDIGCGAGHFLALLKNEVVHSIEYTGIDISRDFILLAKKRFKNNNFILKYVESISTEYLDQFDIICVSELFQYLDFDTQRKLLEKLLQTKAKVMGYMYVVNDDKLNECKKVNVNGYINRVYGQNLFIPSYYLLDGELLNLLNEYKEKYDFIYQKGVLNQKFIYLNKDRAFLIHDEKYKQEKELERERVLDLARITLSPKEWEEYKEENDLDFDALYRETDIGDVLQKKLEEYNEKA